MTHAIDYDLCHCALAVRPLGRGFVIDRLRQALDGAVAAGLVRPKRERSRGCVGRSIERPILIRLDRLLRRQWLYQVQGSNGRPLLLSTTRRLPDASEIWTAARIRENSGRYEQKRCEGERNRYVPLPRNGVTISQLDM